MPAIPRAASRGVVGRKQRDGPGDSSNERVSDAQYSSARRCNVVEERTGRHSPNDGHTKIDHDGPRWRFEQRTSEAANSQSEQDEDDESHEVLRMSRETGDTISTSTVALRGESVGASPYAPDARRPHRSIA